MPSAFHRRIGREERDTPARVAERLNYRRCGEQAHADALARFGQITAENAGAFLEYQEQRIAELLRGGAA